MKVGFIGLGKMGGGMAMNLAKCGEDYLVCDLNPDMLKPFEEKGIHTTLSAVDTADADVIFCCLPNSQDLLMGEQGLYKWMHQGQIVVDSSTLNYKKVIEYNTFLAKYGIEYIDATVAGRRERSLAGTLTIMCGGKKEAFDKVEPLLNCMGSTVLYMGKSGSGQIAKMINNCIAYTTLAALCELLPVAVKLGLEPEKIGEVINHSTAKSYSSEKLIPCMLEGDFTYDTMNACYKNVVNMQEVLTELHLPLPTFTGMMHSYQLAMAQGYGEDYYSAMIRPYEDLLGVKFRK